MYKDKLLFQANSKYHKIEMLYHFIKKYSNRLFCSNPIPIAFQ